MRNRRKPGPRLSAPQIDKARGWRLLGKRTDEIAALLDATEAAVHNSLAADPREQGKPTTIPREVA